MRTRHSVLTVLGMGAFLVAAACSDDNGGSADDSGTQSDAARDADDATDANGAGDGAVGDGAVGDGTAGVDSTSTTCNTDFDQDDACGGQLTGAWTHSEACVNESIFAPVLKACGGATFSDTVASVDGTLSVEGDVFSLDVTTTVTSTLLVPAVCVIVNCGVVAATLELAVDGSSATCTGQGDDCSCDVSFPLATDISSTFSTSDGVATLSSGEQYRYCLDGDTLTYKPLPDTADDEDVTYVLTR